MFTKISDTLTLELRPGHDGFGVDSIVPTSFGGPARNQIFWSENEAEARAFIQGIVFMQAMKASS